MRCRNDPAATYTGKEPSPKGLGWAAHAARLGLRKRGTDGRMWSVAKRANGSKYWKKAPVARKASAAGPAAKRTAAKRSAASPAATKRPIKKTRKPLLHDLYTPLPYAPGGKPPPALFRRWTNQLSATGRRRFETLNQQVIPALRAGGVVAELVPWPATAAGYHMTDDVFRWMREATSWSTDKSVPTIMILLKLDHKSATVTEPRRLHMWHDAITRGTKVKVLAIMREAFGDAFEWSGKSSQSMFLRLT